MQTIDRPTGKRGGPDPGRRRVALGVVVGVLLLPVIVFLVLSKWGVLAAVIIAVVFGLGLWVWRKGFAFIELVAFLIHFDGVGAGQIRMGRAVAFMAVGVILYKLIVEKWRPPAIPTRHWVPVLLLTIFAVLSGAWSDTTSKWFLAMSLLGLALAFFWVSGMLVDSHEKILQYLRAYWYGGLFGSGAGVLALFLGTRSVGFGGDPNFFGLLQASMIPLTVYYRRNETDPTRKLWYTLALVFVFAGAAGAGSRSGIIGACVAIVGTMVTRPRISSGRRVGVFFGALVVAGVAFLVLFVANPANLQRGFADRGAGRLDFWAVTIALIKERPLQGNGFGQTSTKIVPLLSVTPGVEQVGDPREGVSAHNTWLDVMGDLGAIGLLIWISIFAITIIGFIRPRWRRTKELSTTLAVMMLPVLTSSMFLPLVNNKLAWSLIGLSAALQVPSWGTRWRGFLGASDRLALEERSGSADGLATVQGAGSFAPDGRAPDSPADADGPPLWEAPVLARWDLRVSRRFRMSLLVGAVLGFVLFSAVMSTVPIRYTATGGIIVPRLDVTRGNKVVVVSSTQVQGIHTLATSGAYAAELKQQSGLDLSIPEIRDRVTVRRPKFGPFMEIIYSDTDEANTRLALPHIVTALDAVVAGSRKYADAQMADEIRPVIPGEQRYFTGDLYLQAYRDPTFGVEVPRTSWAAFIGALTGMLVATGFVLLQQRRPRVNNDDDLPAAVGLGVWTHVGRAGRRYAATRAQYAQVMTVACEFAPPDQSPRHVVVATPRPDRAARGLAMGVAGALAAEGRRVVLVDAQVDHPLLSARLGGFVRSGLMEAIDGTVPIDSVVRRVNRWRLPVSVRRSVRGRTEQLRFISAGRVLRRRHFDVRPDVLDRFGPDVTVVLLAPSLLGEVPAGPVLDWGDTVVLALVEGRTVTFDAEDAAAQMRTFVHSPAGVVLLDV